MDRITEFEELLRLKSHLLCNGIKSNPLTDEAYLKQNRIDKKRTSNVGSHFEFKYGIIVSVPYDLNSESSSGYHYRAGNPQEYPCITSGPSIKDKFTVTPFTFDRPTWFDSKLSNGKYVTDYIQKEGRDVLICSISNSCCYFANSKPCGFCNLNCGEKSKESDSERRKMIIEAFNIILDQDKKIGSINLTGGNLYTDDRGISNYFDIVKAIRKKSNVPVVIEAAPPKDLSILRNLYDEGASSIEMNIEVWDENMRRLFLPGKSEILKSHYLKAWEKAYNIYGKNNVGSAIILGLESKPSALEGINEMIKCGCIPSIIPFKPSKGATLENFLPPNPDLVYEISLKAGEQLVEHDLDPNVGPGCIGCGACTLEGDAVRYKKMIKS